MFFENSLKFITSAESLKNALEGVFLSKVASLLAAI